MCWLKYYVYIRFSRLVLYDNLSEHNIWVFIVLPGKPANEMDHSHPDWAPSLHLGHTEITATQTARYERKEKRKRARTDRTPEMDETVMYELLPPGKCCRASKYKTLSCICCCYSCIWTFNPNQISFRTINCILFINRRGASITGR